MIPAELAMQRIAAKRPGWATPAVPRKVSIYLLDRGFTVWHWLCSKHLADRVTAGWLVKETKPAPHELTCDDCRREAA